MNLRTILTYYAFTLLLPLSVAQVQASPDFTEDFTSGTAGWLSRTFAPLTFNSSGGPDGGSYVSFVDDFDHFEDGATAFRGHDDFDASNDAFADDWTVNHWITLSAWVRQDGPVPTTFFARIATSDNSPGAAVLNFVSVAPNTWTQLFFDVSRSSPTLILEGPIAYSLVFSAVGNVQIGLTAPTGYEDDTTPITFALDKVAVATPEPASCALLVLGLGQIVLRRRKQTREGVIPHA
jgi:hypothetical protein